MVEVIVYTRPGCLLCQQVMDMLSEAGVRFRQIDIANPEEQRRFIGDQGAGNFPLVGVDGNKVGGYAHIVRLHSQGRLKQLAGPPDEGPADQQVEPQSQERMTWSERMSRLHAAMRPR